MTDLFTSRPFTAERTCRRLVLNELHELHDALMFLMASILLLEALKSPLAVPGCGVRCGISELSDLSQMEEESVNLVEIESCSTWKFVGPLIVDFDTLEKDDCQGV